MDGLLCMILIEITQSQKKVHTHSHMYNLVNNIYIHNYYI